MQRKTIPQDNPVADFGPKIPRLRSERCGRVRVGKYGPVRPFVCFRGSPEMFFPNSKLRGLSPDKVWGWLAGVWFRPLEAGSRGSGVV